VLVERKQERKKEHHAFFIGEREALGRGDVLFKPASWGFVTLATLNRGLTMIMALLP